MFRPSSVGIGFKTNLMRLAILGCGDDPAENEAQSAQKPPVAGCTGQEQIDVVKENYEEPNEEKGDHDHR